MAGKNEWTPTQRRILGVLADGQWHSVTELRACLDDELAGSTALPFHVSNIRARLLPESEGIATLLMGGQVYHQHVRFIAGSDE